MDMWVMGEGERSMNHRTIYLAVGLSFIAFFPPRLASQDASKTDHKRETVVQKVKGASHNGAGPAAQRSYHTSAENWFAPDINETETRVSEAAAAEHFMQLKAQVIADLIRLEDGKNLEPARNPVRTPNSDSLIGGSSIACSGKKIKDSHTQTVMLRQCHRSLWRPQTTNEQLSN